MSVVQKVLRFNEEVKELFNANAAALCDRARLQEEITELEQQLQGFAARKAELLKEYEDVGIDAGELDALLARLATDYELEKPATKKQPVKRLTEAEKIAFLVRVLEANPSLKTFAELNKGYGELAGGRGLGAANDCVKLGLLPADALGETPAGDPGKGRPLDRKVALAFLKNRKVGKQL